MKRLVLAFAVIPSLFAFSAMAEDLDGFISARRLAGDRGVSRNPQYVQQAIRNGDSPVFLRDDERFYTIDDPQKVRDFVGEAVIVSGQLDGDKVIIEKIAKK